MAQELLFTPDIGKFAKIAREAWLHCHILRDGVDLLHVGGGVAILRQLFLVKHWSGNMVQLRRPIQTDAESKLKVGELHS